MKRLRGAPDLRNTENTAEAIISQIDILFSPSDRLALKVYFLRMQCIEFKTYREILLFMGIRSHPNHSDLLLEVATKRKNNLCYSMKFDELEKSWEKHKLVPYKSHLKQIQERL